MIRDFSDADEVSRDLSPFFGRFISTEFISGEKRTDVEVSVFWRYPLYQCPSLLNEGCVFEASYVRLGSVRVCHVRIHRRHFRSSQMRCQMKGPHAALFPRNSA